MYCQNCGTVLPEGTRSCPECETPVAAPQSQPESAELPLKEKRTGLLITLSVIAILALTGATVAAALLLVPSTGAASAVPAGAYAPVMPDTSSNASATVTASSETSAAEAVVTEFYDAINARQFPALLALVIPNTRSAVDPRAFKGWSTTTFQIVRAVITTDSAYVYGHESRRAFGSKDLGVKFALLRVDGVWLIQNWQAVDEGAVNGAMPSTGAGMSGTPLTDATARDIVSSLLKARQVGDAETIRLLTTAKFQDKNAATWLNGVDNTPYFTSFSIRSVKKSGAAYVVTVREQWNSGAETATYSVISAGGSILVDAWTSK
jgi:hypothetical protein